MQENKKMTMNRRQFLSTAALSLAALTLSPLKASWAFSNCRSLSFYHTHTREKLELSYGDAMGYDPGALEKINYFLRDFRSEEVHPIDPRLLDLLCAVREDLGLGLDGTFEVISGYRSPKTNQMLRKRSPGVAKHSLHMSGKAIDIRVCGVRTKKIQQCALGLRCGGVGFYPKSDFVHLDTGRVRFW